MATRKKTTLTSKSGEIKKTAPKKSVHLKSTPSEEMSAHTSDTIAKVSTGMKVKKSYIIAVLAVLMIAGLLYTFRSWIVVAMVNGQPVSRISYIRELERQAGKQTMNSIITKTLIFQEAKKQNVTVSDNEVNAELKKIEENLKKQGQKLDQVLALQGMTREQLVEQIKIQKMIEKMVGKNIEITDKEVDEYIAANKESLPQDADENALKKSAQERLKQQKLNEEVQKWLEKLQKDAKITYFVTI
jgi:parvulin-like peptidyl-prolyl isomerase